MHNLVLLAHRNSNICSTTTFYNSRINGGRIELVVTQESKRDSLIDDKVSSNSRRHESALSITDKMDGAAFTIGELASVNFGMQLRNRKVYKFDVIQDVTDPSALTQTTGSVMQEKMFIDTTSYTQTGNVSLIVKQNAAVAGMKLFTIQRRKNSRSTNRCIP